MLRFVTGLAYGTGRLAKKLRRSWTLWPGRTSQRTDPNGTVERLTCWHARGTGIGWVRTVVAEANDGGREARTAQLARNN